MINIQWSCVPNKRGINSITQPESIQVGRWFVSAAEHSNEIGWGVTCLLGCVLINNYMSKMIDRPQANTLPSASDAILVPRTV